MGKVAIIKKTVQRLYTPDSHDPKNPVHGWFSHWDGNSRDCAFVMDNATFGRMLAAGQVELLEQQTELFK